MNEDDIRIDQIQRYLLGEMEAQELADFQRQLQEDPALAADVALEEELQLVVKYQRRRELKTMLQNVQDDASEESTDGEAAPRSSGGIIRPPWKRVIPYVVGMAAIVVAAVLVFRNVGKDPMHERLYAQNMEEVFERKDSYRGTGGDTVPEPAGYKEYDAKAYSAAYSLLDTTLKDTISLLLHGISGMKIDNFRQAARDFERLENPGIEQDIALEAHWYHALVDLHEMRYKSCLRHLDVFTDESPVHANGAKELHKKVDKLLSENSGQ